MRRFTWILLALAAWFPQRAEAGNFKKVFRRNNCWPQPFIITDRIAVRTTMAVQVNKGWCIQNTLHDEHFDPETGMLNEAGELKIRDILTENPADHRTVYVLRANKPALTAARHQSVGEFASKITENGEVPQIAETRIRPRTASADYINTIGTRYAQSTPDPRLPEATGGSSTSSGGGGGSPGGR
ncbi:MAG TPA: hypothetical protein VMV69_07265 [Pirellulales bacterium]|nr:hypothetical protein [Pirellulales bacterium]